MKPDSGKKKSPPDGTPEGDGPPQLFPPTRWTLISRTLDADSREDALGELCRLYWSPVYFFIRKRGVKEHDAEDLTQGFFAQMLKRKQFQRAAENPEGGRLRSYLLKSVQNFLINQHARKMTEKRGGGVEIIPVDSREAERLFAQNSKEDTSPEDMFDRRWATNVLEESLLRLREEYRSSGKEKDFELLKSTLGQTAGKVSFSEIANRLGMEEGTARVAAFRLRKQFRALVHEEIRQTTSSEEDFQDELNYLRKLLGG